MSQFKLEVTLKQHTPLIHFQADQYGATLRASELKPKLDKFIIHELETINPEIFKKYNEIICEENFSINTEKKYASPYKMRIINESQNERIKCGTYINKKEQEKLKDKKIVPLSGVAYFGDNYAVCSDEIKLIITCFNTKILDLFKDVLPYFFIFNNFGTRQNKGFGSFLPMKIDTESVDNLGEKKIEDILCLKYPVNFKYSNDYRNRNSYNEELREPLQIIHDEYTRIKSGKSYPKKIPSILMNYFNKKNIDWEKNKIIHFLKDNNYAFKKPKEIPSKSNNYKYIRALLGLAEHIEFLNERSNDRIKIKIKDNIDDGKNTIQRFASPILFKIINNNIYLLPDHNFENKMFNREFSFTVDERNNEKSFCLKTPSHNEFNLIDFLSSSLKNWKKFEAKK